jgi:hypothetical protein
MTTRGVLVALVAVGALALATVPVSTADAASANLDAAQAGVLTISDFPAGWTQGDRAPASDKQLDAAAAKIRACKTFLAFSKANRKHPRVESPSFTQGRSDVANTVAAYPSEAAARAAMKTISSTRLPACLDKLFSAVFRSQLAADPSVAKQLRSVVTEVRPVSGVSIGDAAAVYQGVVTVTMKDGSGQRIGLGVLYVRVGDVLDGFSYTAADDISADLQPAIVKSVGRLQAAMSAG